MECILCKIANGENDYGLEEHKYWKVILSREQHTLSTLVLILKEHKVRFSSLTKEELLELNHIQKRIEKAIDSCFRPKLYNYLQCGNNAEHLHFHLIPRYDRDIEYMGKTFTDPNFGDSVKETKEIEDYKIIKKIKEDLQL